MNNIIDPELVQTCRIKLATQLAGYLQKGEIDLKVNYRGVSDAFPNGWHQDLPEVPTVDFIALSKWASELGWDVKPAPEITRPDQLNTPFFRFVRRETR